MDGLFGWGFFFSSAAHPTQTWTTHLIIVQLLFTYNENKRTAGKNSHLCRFVAILLSLYTGRPTSGSNCTWQFDQESFQRSNNIYTATAKDETAWRLKAKFDVKYVHTKRCMHSFEHIEVLVRITHKVDILGCQHLARSGRFHETKVRMHQCNCSI